MYNMSGKHVLKFYFLYYPQLYVFLILKSYTVVYGTFFFKLVMIIIVFCVMYLYFYLDKLHFNISFYEMFLTAQAEYLNIF